MSSVHSPEEQLMLEKLNSNLYSETFIRILQDNWNKYHNLHYLGDLIGEVYNYHVLFKDGEGFEEYITELSGMYDSHYEGIQDRTLSEDSVNYLKFNFEKERAEFIAASIADRLGIDYKTATPEEKEQIKSYFLREYVEEGYVFHAFPDAYRESIEEKGLIVSPDGRGNSADDKLEVEKIFLSHGVVTPIGGYPFYGGSGIYYEHDFRRMFHHTSESPEWFKWFTSGDHTTTNQADVAYSPYILRDKEACRKNVEDLCKNAGLSKEETEYVMSFFNKYYELYKSPELSVALIPKKAVGKADVSTLGVEGMRPEQAIGSIMSDERGIFEEHIGNVSHEDIPRESFDVVSVPPAGMYVQAPESYKTETKEHLVDKEYNLSRIEQILKKDSLVPELRQGLEDARAGINNGSYDDSVTLEAAPTVDEPTAEVSSEPKGDVEPKSDTTPALPEAGSTQEEYFDVRSPEEEHMAAVIRSENQTIAKKKEADRAINKPYVYTLINDNKPSGNGFVSSITVSIIVGILIAMMVTILCLIIV